MGSEFLLLGEGMVIKIKSKKPPSLNDTKQREERVMKRSKWDQYGEGRQRRSVKDCPSVNGGKCQRNMSTV